MTKTVRGSIILALSSGPKSRRELVRLIETNKSTLSTNLANLLREGAISQKKQKCDCCGAQLTLLVLEFVPPPKKRKPRKDKGVKVAAPIVRPPVKINLPKHDGSVFGLMAAQLGA